MAKAVKYPAEYFFLIVLILSLPLFEAPKNVFAFLFALTWFYNRWRARDLAGKWDGWDSLIAVWLASGYVVAAFAGLHRSEWRGATDLLRYGVVFWCIKRSGYGRQELRWASMALIASTTIALGWGFWSLLISHTHDTLELNSVGEVNHSAVYVVTSYGVLLAAILAFWRRWNPLWRFVGVILALFFAAGVLMSASRAAVGVLFLLTLMLAVVWLRRSRTPLLVLTTVMAVSIVIGYFAPPAVLQKERNNEEKNRVLSYRNLIWNGAVVVWRRYPVFGVGMDNYVATNKHIREFVEAEGKVYNPAQYYVTSHAHSLYMNTLVERGAFGLLVVLAVVFTWLYWLIQFVPEKEDADIAWMLWGGSFSAWFVTTVIGLVNTTLHHENAILSTLLLGFWLVFLQQKKAEKIAAVDVSVRA